MLKRILGNFRLTPSVTLSLLALFVALGSTGYAANGGAFILGVINGATQRTYLGANYNGTALQLNNTSAGASATALTLTVAAGHPPMKVNTVAKVTNLNADYLDGLDSAALTHAMRVSYNLAAGAVSAPITVPANRPVQLVGVSLTTGDPGVGQTSLLVTPAGLTMCVGLHSYPESSSVASGYNLVGSGVTIVYIDYNDNVFVETAGAGAVRVHNFGPNAQTGSVSLMW
jgi:hypothetical protein